MLNCFSVYKLIRISFVPTNFFIHGCLEAGENMCLKGKLHLLILIILSVGDVFADGCNVSGMWFDPMNSNMEYSLYQYGTTLTGKSKYIDDECGAFIMSGTVNNNTVSFETTSEKSGQTPECESHEKVSATFSRDCILLKGTATDDKGSDEFNLYREPIKITSPASGTEFVINTEPHMPTLKVTAEVYIPSSMTYLNNFISRNEQAPFSWKVKIEHTLRADKIVKGELNEVATSGGVYEPDFQQIGWPLGGKLTLSVHYFHSVHDEKEYFIKGTNPGKVLIEQMVTSPVLRHIACDESHYKQFEANREGGIGFPVVGANDQGTPIGGIGIFQAFNPDPKDFQIWDWRNNVKYGIDLFETKKIAAKKMPKTELRRLNEERQVLHLPLCKNLPPLSEEQIEREALRRYNGGREYRWEPRNDKDCKGQWVIKPWLPPHAIVNYVEKVLSCTI